MLKLVVGTVLTLGLLMLATEAQDLVQVGLYYESYCPYSRNFIATQLMPTYALVPEIMNATIVPFGNAQFYPVGDSWTFTCQHGPEECTGNIIQSCELYYYPANSDSIPFLGCVAGSSDPNNNSQECAEASDQDWDLINTCATTDEGKQLLHDNGVLTQALRPPLTSVPWILINGVHSNVLNTMAQDDLLSLVCKTYQGPKPAACPAQ